MKLSEMNTIQTLNFMAKTIKPIKTIISKGEILSKISKINESVKEDLSETEKHEVYTQNGIKLMFELIETMTSDFQDETIEILAASSEKSIEELKAQKGFTTISELKELLTDKATIDFFYSLMK